MVIQVGQPIKSSDFINESEASLTASENAGKVPKLESDGKIDGSFLRSPVPVVRVYEPLRYGDSTTRINVTRPSGIISRYSWNGSGTNPQINSTNFAVGKVVGLSGFNSANNNGDFVITASGNNYFEIENASGVAESNIYGPYIYVISDTWTKPSGLKYIEVEVVGGGGGGGGGEGSRTDNYGGSGGGAGGYAKKIISADDLGESETITIGIGGAGGASSSPGGTGGTTYFGSILSASGGVGGQDDGGTPGAGGSGTGGDINIGGGNGHKGQTNKGFFGNGGLSFLGVLGAGGDGGSGYGHDGKSGVVIITDHY